MLKVVPLITVILLPVHFDCQFGSINIALRIILFKKHTDIIRKVTVEIINSMP